jgi:hypothetical protein
MKLNLSLSKDTFSKLFAKKQSAPARSVGHPSRDWMILLGVTAVVVVLSFVYHLNLFFSVNTSNPSLGNTTIEKTPVNEGELTAILSAITAREARFEELKGQFATTSDPSR